uniref:AlpA family transcriptional regulator n=1 Tax=Klebsiella sp. TaxID=576 RepID=UPI00258EF40B
MKTRADNNDAFPESGNVRMRQVVQFLAMSESSVYRLIKNTDFPRPVHLSSRLVVFDAAEIRQWQCKYPSFSSTHFLRVPIF